VIGTKTLRGRLALSGMVAAAFAVLLLTLAFAFLLQRRLDAEALDVLRGRVDAATAAISVQDDGTLQVSASQGDGDLNTGVWVYQAKTALVRAGGGPAVQSSADSLVGTNERLLINDAMSTEFLSEAVTKDGQTVGTVVAAISLDPYRRSSRATVVGAVSLGATLVLFVSLVARVVATRALKPVTEMTRQAGEWSASDTSLRFGAGPRPGELADLAGNLDALLDRLSAVLRREQQLSAEISHELRTPLAGIIAESDLFAARPRTKSEAERAMRTVGDGARRMERILDTLLTAARAEGSGAKGRCDPVVVAEEMAVPVEVIGSVPFVGADAEVLERVLAPLVENARRYATTGVSIRVSADSQAVMLEVLDDGPGVMAGSEEDVFTPGRRLNPADGHDGAGLGLALARRLVRAGGGDLTSTAGPGGCFTVRLPRA
jgi:two-component system heavy metal sensor histidine kinase CusS